MCRSSVAPSVRHQLHAGQPFRKGIVTIEAVNFTNGLGLERLFLSAALGVTRFLQGPTV